MVCHRSDIQRHIQQQSLPPETLAFVNKMAGNKERYICTFYINGLVGQLETKIEGSITSLAPSVFKGTMGISNLYIIYPDKTLHYTANFNLIPSPVL